MIPNESFTEASPLSVQGEKKFEKWKQLSNSLRVSEIVGQYESILPDGIFKETLRGNYEFLQQYFNVSDKDFIFERENKDFNGVAPNDSHLIHLAVMSGNVQCTLLLIEQFPDYVNFAGGDGQTPLHVAASLARVFDVACLLDVPGCNINATDKKGNTPLHYSVLAKDRLGTEYLINKGALISVQNTDGLNPAHLAARENFDYGCELMVIRDKSRSLVQKCKQGKLPYDYALERGNTQLATMVLLETRKQSINIKFIRENHFMVSNCAFILLYQFCFVFLPLWCTLLFTLVLMYIAYNDYDWVYRSFFSFWIVYLAWFTLTGFAILLPVAMDYKFLMFLASGGAPLIWYFYLKLAQIPARSCSRASDDIELMYKFLSQNEVRKDSFSLDEADKYCPTCLINRPEHSKHCTICYRCVSEFDHHCLWVDSCVGRDNHHYFVGYIVCMAIASPCISYFYMHHMFTYPDVTLAWESGILPWLSVMYYSHAWMFHFTALCMAFTPWILFTCFWQLVCIGLGITLNEWINRKRLGIEHKFPKTYRGALANCKKFLFTFSRFIDL